MTRFVGHRSGGYIKAVRKGSVIRKGDTASTRYAIDAQLA